MSGTYWNYRVVRQDRGDETAYAIREVHYDEEHQVASWTAHDMQPWGTSLDELRTDLQLMLLALEKPVLDPGELEAR